MLVEKSLAGPKGQMIVGSKSDGPQGHEKRANVSR